MHLPPIGILKDVRDIAHIKQVQDVINKAHSENKKKYMSWIEQMKSLEEGLEDKVADEKISQKAEQKGKAEERKDMEIRDSILDI